MKRGDLVQIDEQRWLVCQVVGTQALLANAEGKLARTLTSLPRAKVLCNPTTDWPFVLVNSALSWGKLKVVGHPQTNGTVVPLRPFEDWLWGEPLRTSGALYLNPQVGLKQFDTLTLQFEKHTSGVQVPKGFGTLGQRVARTKAPPADRRPTIYDRLLGGGGEDE